MARKCELTGKAPMSGNNVAHSNLKTRRRFIPNIQKKRVFDTESGKWITLKLSAKALRTIDKIGLQAMLKRAEKIN